MARVYQEKCLRCKTRKRRYFSGACEPCEMLTRAEDTWELYGLKKESDRRSEYREIAKEYNKLARKGLNQGQIAEAMGVERKYLTSLIYRIKDAGIPVVSLTKRPIGTPAPKPTTRKQHRSNNKHGSGRWGIRRCKCDLCMAVRRKTRAELEAGRLAAGLPPKKH